MIPTGESVVRQGMHGDPPAETVTILFQAADAESLNRSGLAAPFAKRFILAARSAVNVPSRRNNLPIE